MEIQTHLKSRVFSNIWLRRLPLAGLLILCAQPSHGEPDGEENTVASRKALRHHPVAFHSAANRPITHRAAPINERYDWIPRATVVRSVPPVPTEELRAKRAVPISFPRIRKKTQVPSEAMSDPTPLASKQIVNSPPAANRFPASPSPQTLVRRCDVMALQGLEYKFGSVDPASGGLDCSSTVQYLLRQEGIKNVPRTAYTQYMWLKNMGTLNKVTRWTWSTERVANRIRPGDLMFWTGTYNTGRSPNISHVMIYLGRDANNGKHYMFGASSRKSKGLHGNAVDVYEFIYPRKNGKSNFAGFGSVSGLRR